MLGLGGPDADDHQAVEWGAPPAGGDARLQCPGDMPDADDAFMEGMFASQTAWNEIMGWNVVKAFNIIPDPELQVLVVVGSGHAIFGQGIPTRAELFKSGLRQIIIMPQTVEDVMAPDEIREEELDLEGDYLWFTPSASDPPGIERRPPPAMPPPRF